MEFFEDGRLELYNLRDDIGEKNNLAAKIPSRPRNCTRNCSPGKEINAPMPTPNTDIRKPPAAPKAGKAKAAGRRRRDWGSGIKKSGRSPRLSTPSPASPIA